MRYRSVSYTHLDVYKRQVVPHNYWSGKNCPAPLMTNGRPGYKWSWFISRVDYYYCLLYTSGTGLFSFLWNVPLNTLRAAHSATAPPAILIRNCLLYTSRCV